jgi:hypothetical protein
MAADKGRLVGAKKHDGVGDLVGLADAAERYGRHETGLSFGVAGKAIEHPGLGRPGCYRIDANPRARDLERRGCGEPLDRVLAGGIDGGVGGARVTIGRGDIDDAAAC